MTEARESERHYCKTSASEAEFPAMLPKKRKLIVTNYNDSFDIDNNRNSLVGSPPFRQDAVIGFSQLTPVSKSPLEIQTSQNYLSPNKYQNNEPTVENNTVDTVEQYSVKTIDQDNNHSSTAIFKQVPETSRTASSSMVNGGVFKASLNDDQNQCYTTLINEIKSLKATVIVKNKKINTLYRNQQEMLQQLDTLSAKVDAVLANDKKNNALLQFVASDITKNKKRKITKDNLFVYPPVPFSTKHELCEFNEQLSSPEFKEQMVIFIAILN